MPWLFPSPASPAACAYLVCALTLCGCGDREPEAENSGNTRTESKAHRETTTIDRIPSKEEIARKLEEIRLPVVDLRDTPLEEAVAWLAEQGRVYDVEKGTGVNIRFDAELLNSWLRSEQVTLRFNDVPLGEVLEYACALHGMTFLIDPEMVVIVPHSSVGDDILFTRFFEEPDEFQRGPDEASGVRAGLEGLGIVFPEGAEASYDSLTKQLMVRNKREQHLLIEMQFDRMQEPNAEEHLANFLAIRELEEKLRDIVLPVVDFDKTPLDDALTTLQRLSVEHDSRTENPAHRGVLIRRSPAPETSFSGELGFDEDAADPGRTPVTLRLREVPLSEALRYTASLAYMNYRVEPEGVLVTPHAYREDLETRAFRVRSDLFDLTPANSQITVADPFSTGDTLTMNPLQHLLEGMGARVSVLHGYIYYNSEASLLVVRDVDYNMDVFEAAVGFLNSEGAPPEWTETEMNRVEEKLGKIVLPTVTFDRVPLERVLEYLSARSREIDDDPDPWSRGIYLAVDPGGLHPSDDPGLAGSDPFESDSAFSKALDAYQEHQDRIRNHPIAIRLNNVSLAEAIVEIAKQAGLQSFVEASRVVLRP